tara:strand:- start:1181 stop:1483 length:303 start_codon:yes stop_codon:yes gene_type:complete
MYNSQYQYLYPGSYQYKNRFEMGLMTGIFSGWGMKEWLMFIAVVIVVVMVMKAMKPKAPAAAAAGAGDAQLTPAQQAQQIADNLEEQTDSVTERFLNFFK